MSHQTASFPPILCVLGVRPVRPMQAWSCLPFGPTGLDRPTLVPQGALCTFITSPSKVFHLSFMEACVLPPALVYRCEITECTHQLMNRLANLERIFFLPASSELLTVQIWVALSNPCEAAWAFLQNAVIPDLQVIATEPFSSPAVNDFPPASPSPRKCINLH